MASASIPGLPLFQLEWGKMGEFLHICSTSTLGSRMDLHRNRKRQTICSSLFFQRSGKVPHGVDPILGVSDGVSSSEHQGEPNPLRNIPGPHFFFYQQTSYVVQCPLEVSLKGDMYLDHLLFFAGSGHHRRTIRMHQVESRIVTIIGKKWGDLNGRVHHAVIAELCVR